MHKIMSFKLTFFLNGNSSITFIMKRFKILQVMLFNLIRLEDVVVGDLRVVDVPQAPVFQPVDGVTSPVSFLINRIAVLADQK